MDGMRWGLLRTLCLFEVNTVADGGVGSTEPLPSRGGAFSLPGGFGQARFALEDG